MHDVVRFSQRLRKNFSSSVTLTDDSFKIYYPSVIFIFLMIMRHIAYLFFSLFKEIIKGVERRDEETPREADE